jgi:hypothetical protein
MSEQAPKPMHVSDITERLNRAEAEQTILENSNEAPQTGDIANEKENAVSIDDFLDDTSERQEEDGISETKRRKLGSAGLHSFLARRQDKRAHHIASTSHYADQAKQARTGWLPGIHEEQVQKKHADGTRVVDENGNAVLEPNKKAFPARKSAQQQAAATVLGIEKGHNKLFPKGQKIGGVRSFRGVRMADRLLPNGQKAEERARSNNAAAYREILNTPDFEADRLAEGASIDPELISRDWSAELDPANVILFRKKLIASLREPVQKPAEQRLTNGGIHTIHSGLIAAYLGVPNELILNERNGKGHALPPQVLSKLNFMLRLPDEILEQMAEGEADVTPLDRMEEAANAEREAREKHGTTFPAAGGITVNPALTRVMRQPRRLSREAPSRKLRQDRDDTQTQKSAPETSDNIRTSRARQGSPEMRLQTQYPDLFNETTYNRTLETIDDRLRDYETRFHEAPNQYVAGGIAREVIREEVLDACGTDATVEVFNTFGRHVALHEDYLREQAEGEERTGTDSSNSADGAENNVESESSEPGALRQEDLVLIESVLNKEIMESGLNDPKMFGKVRSDVFAAYYAGKLDSSSPEKLSEAARMIALERLTAPEEKSYTETVEGSAEAHDYRSDPAYAEFFTDEKLGDLEAKMSPAIEQALKRGLHEINKIRTNAGNEPLQSIPEKHKNEIIDRVSKAKTREFLKDNEASDDLVNQITQARLNKFQPGTKHAE